MRQKRKGLAFLLCVVLVLTQLGTGAFAASVCQVIFDPMGGSLAGAVSVNVGVGESVPQPADPSKGEFTFAGWYKDSPSTLWDFNADKAPDSASMTLRALWTATVTFDSMGGSRVNAQVVNEGGRVSEPTPPSYTGQSFGGWYVDPDYNTRYDFNTMVTGSLTLYAKWDTLVSYTVTFNTNGGGDVAAQTVESGRTATQVTPSRSGYTFGGWYTDAALTSSYSFATPVTADITLYAKWNDSGSGGDSTDDGKRAQSMTFANNRTKTYGDDDFTTTATTNSNGGAISYSSSDTSVATIDGDGLVHIVGAGTTTIEAKAAATDRYAETTRRYTLKVDKATPSTYEAVSCLNVSDGDTLGDAELSGSFTGVDGETLAGELKWNSSSTTKVKQGTSYTWKFTPDDKSNYETRTGTLVPWAKTGSTSKTTTSTDSKGVKTRTTTTRNAQSNGDTTELITTEITDNKNNVETYATTHKLNNRVTDMDATCTVTVATGTASEAAVTSALSALRNVQSGAGTKGLSELVFDASRGTRDSLTIGANNFKSIAELNYTKLTVILPEGKYTLDSEALKSLGNQSGAVTFTLERPLRSNLSKEVTDAAGNDIEIVDLTISAGEKAVEALDGTTNAYINLASGSSSNRVYHITGAGSRTSVEDVAYNSSEGQIYFPIKKFGYHSLGQRGSELPFYDVSESYWAYDSIRYVYNEGLFSGTSATQFSPETVMTRGMLVTALWRHADKPQGNVNPFVDVRTTDYCAEAIMWANEKGLISGVGGNRFAPDSAITREQLATVLYNYADLLGKDTKASGKLTGFSDNKSIEKWAQTPMKWAVGKGLLQGSNGRLYPTYGATRAEVATMLTRLINMEEK